MGNGGKTIRLILGGLGLTLLPALAAAESACRNDQISLRGDWGEARFTVEVADDANERAQGLMHRESMARSAGMLFVYDSARTVRFWMKNTLIPLDMIFADETGTVQHIHRMAEPESEEMIFGGNNIQYILEINGGMADALKIGEGSEMRHPDISPEQAAWPC
ncbi:MAG: DUF192 domain-containing protein [Marinovum algicola]|uniref:DUF192 domain-containing protein n=1 Tax=Roseobacteraceae TaxID=2854170 RepID=UPI0032ED552F